MMSKKNKGYFMDGFNIIWEISISNSERKILNIKFQIKQNKYIK